MMATLIEVARGIHPAELVVKNARVFNPFTSEWEETGFAVHQGRIAGIGEYQGLRELDARNHFVLPGFIDAHVHIESSLLTPSEYGRLVLTHGTTTVIADPHEIANVCGKAGIDYMIKARTHSPLDICYTAPSCVPATPLDESAENLESDKLRPYIESGGFIGLSEMMNVPGVLNEAPEVLAKLALSDIRDGHAPFLTGPDLQAYIAAGIQSDHETITEPEGREKIRRGMYLFIREGSTEQNLRDLLPIVNRKTVPRCSFCTDDRHVDLLVETGHIDDCIRKAIAYGLEPELAYRMATLSPAERFGLSDRGALSPGRLADFSIIENLTECRVTRTFKKGNEISNIPSTAPLPITYQFRTRVPDIAEIAITGNGMARVIGILQNQIATEALTRKITNDHIPDFAQDILKVVVASRYDNSRIGVGLVHGLKMTNGAIASSVAHDSHHIIATGTSDDDILTACAEVIKHRGGIACVCDGRTEILPLSCAGLMAEGPYEKVYEQFRSITRMTEMTGAIKNPFMYLSFLSLTVIPSLRVTPGGVFDAHAFAQVPLFVKRDE